MTFDEYKARAKADLDAVFEAGKAQGGGGSGDDYYNTFWDAYQENGNRVHCNYAFSMRGWTDTNYKPKYPFKPMTYANGMFTQSNITDILYPLDFTGLSGNAGSVFQACGGLKTIRTLKVKETNTYSAWFDNCGKLENIEFDGTIGKNLDIHWSTLLTAESYHSIITHCSKTSNFTLTLPPYETVKAVYDAKYGEGAWDTIIKEYSNVSIVYS